MGEDAAAPQWQRLAPGLAYRVFSPVQNSRVHVLRLDLTERRLRLQVSAPELRGQTLPGMPTTATALASFNASFFDRRYTPRGVTVSDGQSWAPVLEAGASPYMACDRQQRCRIQFEDTAQLPTHSFNAVAGTPWLLRNGQARTVADDATCAAFCARSHPRTALGLSENGRWLWVALAEGRRPPVAGLSLVQLAQVLRALGAHQAINLDGGGSSSLWLHGRAVMARPANEPAERPLANAVHIVVAEVD